MSAPSGPTVAGRLVAAVSAAVVIFAVAVVMLGLTPWIAAVVFLVLALGVTGWGLLKLRQERAGLRNEVHDLERSALLLAERIRVAREVHDLVSHGLGMITVRASSALYLAQQHPDSSSNDQTEALQEALTDIERTSRDATSGLRRTIQALRDPEETVTLKPVESLTDLPAIIAGAETAGLSVTYRNRHATDLSASLQATIVALIREGLANTARHAGPTDVTVNLEHAAGIVTVSVQDSGPAPSWQSQPGSGHGLIGLHERTAALGGTLHAGPSDSHPGYELRAVFAEANT